MILVDDRDGSQELSLMFQALDVCPVKVTRLPAGDFNFVGYGPDKDPLTGEDELVSVGVERKTLGDFISSTESGRLTDEFKGQVQKMKLYHHYQFLIFEAAIRPNPEERYVEVPRRGGWELPRTGMSRYRKVPYSAIDRRLFSLQLQAGIHVIRTQNPAGTVETVTNLYSWFQTPWDKHSTLKQFYTPPPPTAMLYQPSMDEDLEGYRRWLCRMVAKELPNVGWERSQGCVEAFGSVTRMVNATRKQWKQVEGIGPITTTKIMKALGAMEEE